MMTSSPPAPPGTNDQLSPVRSSRPPVPDGSVVEISGRHAVIDGQSDVSRWLQFREWDDVPPQTARTYQFDVVSGASALLSGKVDSAWW